MGTYTKEQLTTQLERIQTAAASTRTAIINRGINFCPADAKLADLTYYAKFLCDFPDIRLDYIENGPADGANRKAVYFDTGFVPDTSTRVEIKYYISQTDYEQVVFGCNGTGYYFFESPGSSTVGYRFTGGNAALNVNTVATTGTHVVTTYRDNLAPKMIIDGTTHTGVDTLLNTISYPIYLFARNASGSAANQCLGETRIYYVKIWEDNNLVRFYVPVLHYYNGQYTPCFYDKVNDNYIFNKSVGTVTYSRSEDIMLDYIGAQPETAIPVTATTNMRYYTGIVPSINMQVDTRFRLLWGGENYIWGAATDGTTSPTWQPVSIGYPGNLTTLRANFGADTSSSRTVNMTTLGISGDCITSFYYNSSNHGNCYLNGMKYTNTNAITKFPTTDIHLFSRHGNSQNVNPRNGARMYYCIFTTSFVPTKTYIPVLHNGTPGFYDIINNRYTYNSGSGTVSYQILN